MSKICFKYQFRNSTPRRLTNSNMVSFFEVRTNLSIHFFLHIKQLEITFESNFLQLFCWFLNVLLLFSLRKKVQKIRKITHHKKKVQFYETAMHCLPQRLKSTFFEIFWMERRPDGVGNEKNSKMLILAFEVGNRANAQQSDFKK